MDNKIVEISPVPLNKGERLFVEDMKAYHDKSENYFADKELYLLRNLSKGKGVGFFEAPAPNFTQFEGCVWPPDLTCGLTDWREP